jgi:hypothetical protein
MSLLFPLSDHTGTKVSGQRDSTVFVVDPTLSLFYEKKSKKTASQKVHLRRCASSCVIAAYFYVRLTLRNLSTEGADSPRSWRESPVSGALHLVVFEQPE